MNILRQATIYSFTVVVLSLLADALFFGFYQGLHPKRELESVLITHGFMHLGVFILGFIGAVLGFWIFDKRALHSRQIVLVACLFVLASLFAALPAQALLGPLGVVGWLLFGSMIFSGIASKLFKQSSPRD